MKSWPRPFSRYIWYTLAKKSSFASAVIIANFCSGTFKRIVPDEYYGTYFTPMRSGDYCWQQYCSSQVATPSTSSDLWTIQERWQCYLPSDTSEHTPPEPQPDRLTQRHSIYLPRKDGRLSWPRWPVTFTRPQTVTHTHSSTNPASGSSALLGVELATCWSLVRSTP